MGWNTGYTIFEATVVGAYDLGKLDKDLLAVLMEPYRDSDIDSGGARGLLSNDGKDVLQIVIETMGLSMPTRPSRSHHEDPDGWEAFYSAEYEQFRKITHEFGW
jgi:hypothetical protein